MRHYGVPSETYARFQHDQRCVTVKCVAEADGVEWMRGLLDEYRWGKTYRAVIGKISARRKSYRTYRVYPTEADDVWDVLGEHEFDRHFEIVGDTISFIDHVKTIKDFDYSDLPPFTSYKASLRTENNTDENGVLLTNSLLRGE